jgi:hypothetical protein
MKSQGFSLTFFLGWIITIIGSFVTWAILFTEWNRPAIVCAAEILTITCLTLLMVIPLILLSMLRNTRIVADSTKGPTAGPQNLTKAEQFLADFSNPQRDNIADAVLKD